MLMKYHFASYVQQRHECSYVEVTVKYTVGVIHAYFTRNSNKTCVGNSKDF